jgi:SAM-dependent methyltransferase
MTPLSVITDRREEIALIEQCIRSRAVAGHPLEILEAGCGRRWEVKLDGVEYVLTGIDMDAEALRLRREVQKDLDEAIVGDLRTVALPDARFDVIYCYYVLEHVLDAHIVLENFTRWLRPGGIAIVKIPDPHSVHGFFTRMTPHWFHVFFYRHVLGRVTAGKPGYPPYPVHYDREVSRAGIREYCDSKRVSLLVERGDGSTEKARRLAHRAVQIYRKVMGPLSLGTLSNRHSDLLYVIAKP